MLTLSGVGAAYGSVPAIGDVSISVGEGEAVGLLGANGAGKSTTLRAISGLVRLTSGTINFLGTNIAALPPYVIAALGIAHVPEGRQVFPELTVKENLEIGAYIPAARTDRGRTLDLVFSIFPVLAERRKQLAGTMSGGEQQMLALGRGLMMKPRLLMLDEPSLGLAPVITDLTFQKIAEIHAMGTAILLVEQNAGRDAHARAASLRAGERQGDHARPQCGVGKQQAGAGSLSRNIASQLRRCRPHSSVAGNPGDTTSITRRSEGRPKIVTSCRRQFLVCLNKRIRAGRGAFKTDSRCLRTTSVKRIRSPNGLPLQTTDETNQCSAPPLMSIRSRETICPRPTNAR